MTSASLSANRSSGEMTIGQVLFSFSGRVPRSVYWLYFLAYYIVYFFFYLIIFVYRSARTEAGPLDFAVLTIISIFIFVSLYTSLAIQVKRFHDRDRSGWFLLLSLIPIVNIWVLIELGFLRGSEGDNEYGPELQGVIYRRRRTKRKKLQPAK